MPAVEAQPNQAAGIRLVPSPLSGVVPPVEHRFKPGNNANPLGRPKGAQPRMALLQALAAKPTADGVGAKCVELAEQMLAAALNGDSAKVNAIAEVIAQADGKPREYVETIHRTRFTVEFVLPELDAQGERIRKALPE